MPEPRGLHGWLSNTKDKFKQLLRKNRSNAIHSRPANSSPQTTTSTTRVENEAEPRSSPISAGDSNEAEPTAASESSAAELAGEQDTESRDRPSHPLDRTSQAVQVTEVSVASPLTRSVDDVRPNLSRPTAATRRHEAADTHSNTDTSIASPTLPQDALPAAVHAPLVGSLPSSTQSAGAPQLDALPVLNTNTTTQEAQTAASSQPTTITASASPVANTIETGSSQPVESLWYSRRTPRWNEAIKRWKEDSNTKDQYLELEKLMKDAVDSPIERADFLSQLQPTSKPSSKWRLRLKRCEPILNAAKGLVTSLASLDPHKVAPIICTSVFFGLNVSIS